MRLLLIALLFAGNAYANFETAKFSDMKEWQSHDFTNTAQALRNSCKSLSRNKNTSGSALDIKLSDWKDICDSADGLKDSDMKAFLQDKFQPLLLKSDAFFTGYFEAHMNVSDKKTGKYNVPVLQSVDNVAKNYDRKRIEKSAAKGDFKVLFWADNAIDLFLAQIQGSASVTYPDGSVKRISYAGNNGHGYKSIGKYLIESGRLESLPDGWFSIRDYLEANPDEANGIMWQNPRYIFFQPNPNAETFGRFRTALIPSRSAAADDELMPFGTPIWVEITADEKLNLAPRLLYIHDTGSAINGLGRTDIFFGAGKHALDIAARLRHSGKLYILVPKAYSKRKKL